MTLDQFITKWNGKKADWDNAYGGQCVDLFRFYNNEVLEISQPKGVVGASDFWANYDTDPVLNTNFTKIPNTADFKPSKGDVMIWNKNAGGGFGHISIVSDNNATLDKFWSFDQNWRALNVCEITEHNYNNVFGVLRPKKESMPDALQECLAQHTKLVDEATARENKITQLEMDKKSLQETIDRLEIDKKSLEEDVRELNDDVEKLAEQLKDCQQMGEIYKIEAEVQIAGKTWVINGLSADNSGKLTANYKVKEG